MGELKTFMVGQFGPKDIGRYGSTRTNIKIHVPHCTSLKRIGDGVR